MTCARWLGSRLSALVLLLAASAWAAAGAAKEAGAGVGRASAGFAAFEAELFAKEAAHDAKNKTAARNIVLFLPDEVRAESVGGVYGHPLTQTPALARLASRGTTFTSAHVSQTQCSPSRCALLTGWPLHVRGHRTQQHLLQAGEPNMFSYLRRAGFHVAWAGKNDALSQEAMKEGVSEILSTSAKDGPAAAIAWLRRRDPPPPEPFALFVPSIGAHPPYQSVVARGKGFSVDEAGYYSFWDNGTTRLNPREVMLAAPLRPRITNVTVASSKKPAYYGPAGIPAFRNLTALPDEFFYGINAAYLDAIEGIDKQLDDLMAALSVPDINGTDQNETLAHRTAVAFTSDHGDFAGDAGLVEKWPGGLDDMLTRVPLVIAPPLTSDRAMPTGRSDAFARGAVVRSPVQQIDLMATLLELVGVHTTHTHFSSSLVAALHQGEAAVDPKRFVFSEGGFRYPSEIEPLHSGGMGSAPRDRRSAYWPRAAEESFGCRFTSANWQEHASDPMCARASPRAVMVRNGSAKLVSRPDGISELYDIGADPRELTNLYGAPEHAALQADLTEELLSWFIKTSDVTPWKEDPRGFAPTPAVATAVHA